MKVIDGGRVVPRGLASADATTLVAATTAFGVALYAEAAGDRGNIFLSPASVSAALAMTYAGARGQTSAEIGRTLQFGAIDQTLLHRTLGLLLETIADATDVDVAIANALFAQEGYPFLPEFTALLAAHYRAGLREVDFASASEGARRAINEWTRRETRERIVDLLPPGILDAGSRLVLVNAAYFKGSWGAPFLEKDTSHQPFHRLNGQSTPVPLMRRSGSYKVADLDDAQLLSLPYGGGALAMVAILPRRNDGLPDLEAKLDSNLGAWLERLEAARPREVDVYLPRFRIEAAFRLDEALKRLEMRAAFDVEEADFSGMTGERDLYLSAVVHKAFVDVNEQGTTAAAATAVVAGLRGIPRARPAFRADHPFVFLIVDSRTRYPLFMGRLLDPTGASDTAV